ncbi:unnamed protein product [Symbiodinium microadriaticum]|nr:unnamed protein product [Symbiodinium microadriaticum]
MRQSCTLVESPLAWLSQDSTSTSSWPYGLAAPASWRRSCSSSRVLSFHANTAHQQQANTHQSPGGQQQPQQQQQQQPQAPQESQPATAGNEPAAPSSSQAGANGSKPRNAQGQDAQDDQEEEEDGGDDDEVADAVPEPKKPAETAKEAAFKDALKKHKEQVLKDEEQRKEEEELKEKAKKRLEMERKAKDMLKALPPIPEDGHANHRSWEAQLSASDVKQELQASREMDALRSKQHADPGALLAKDLRGAFLTYLGSNSPHHLASASARASAGEEADMAHHQSWEAKLTAEDMKNQMLSSRERDSLASSAVGSADANKTLRERDEGVSGAGGKGKNIGDGDAEDKVEVGSSGGSGTLLPLIHQVGQSIGLNDVLKNSVESFNLAFRQSPYPKFFCGKEGETTRELEETDHPALYFSFPVRNVSITLTNLGKLGKGPEEVVWDAEFSSRKDFKGVVGNMRPTGGTKPRYKPPCFPSKTKYRMQLRVISEDEGEAAGHPVDMHIPVSSKPLNVGPDMRTSKALNLNSEINSISKTTTTLMARCLNPHTVLELHSHNLQQPGTVTIPSDIMRITPIIKGTNTPTKAAIADSITGLEGVLVSDYGSSSIWALNPSESRARDQLLDLWDRSGEYNLRFQELKRAGALPNSPAECPRKWVLSKLEKFTDDQLRAPCRARSRWAHGCALDLAPFAVFGDRLGLDIPLADTKEYVMGKVGRRDLDACCSNPSLWLKRDVADCWALDLCFASPWASGPLRRPFDASWCSWVKAVITIRWPGQLVRRAAAQLEAAVPEDEELAEEEAAPAKKRRRLVQQPAGSWLRAFGLWRDQAGPWITAATDPEAWNSYSIEVGTVLGRLDKIETAKGQWAEMTFLSVSDDHLLWWLNSGPGKDANWEFEVHFCKSGERSCRQGRRGRNLDFQTDKFRNVPLGHLAEHRIEWVKKSPCKKYVDEEVTRMSGERPTGQNEAHPDAGQGLVFDEAGLSAAEAEDPALKNLSELEKELARQRKRARNGKQLTTMVEVLDPPKGGGRWFGQEVARDPKALEVSSGSSDNESVFRDGPSFGNGTSLQLQLQEYALKCPGRRKGILAADTLVQRLKDFDPPTDEEAPDTGFLNFEIGELGTCDDDGLPTRSADLSMKGVQQPREAAPERRALLLFRGPTPAIQRPFAHHPALVQTGQVAMTEDNVEWVRMFVAVADEDVPLDKKGLITSGDTLLYIGQMTGVMAEKDSYLVLDSEDLESAFNLSGDRQRVQLDGKGRFRSCFPPLYSVLQEVYGVMDWGRDGAEIILRVSVLDEVLCFAALLPLAETDLTSSISPTISCTDASPSGGGASVATVLKDKSRALQANQHVWAGASARVLANAGGEWQWFTFSHCCHGGDREADRCAQLKFLARGPPQPECEGHPEVPKQSPSCDIENQDEYPWSFCLAFIEGVHDELSARYTEPFGFKAMSPEGLKHYQLKGATRGLQDDLAVDWTVSQTIKLLETMNTQEEAQHLRKEPQHINILELTVFLTELRRRNLNRRDHLRFLEITDRLPHTMLQLDDVLAESINHLFQVPSAPPDLSTLLEELATRSLAMPHHALVLVGGQGFGCSGSTVNRFDLALLVLLGFAFFLRTMELVTLRFSHARRHARLFPDQGPDRSIDEDAEFEVQLLDRNDPLIQERLKDAENHYDGVRSGDSFGSGTSGSGLPGAVSGPANQDKIGKMLKELMKFEKLGPYIAAVPADVAILAPSRRPAPRTARPSYLHFL